MMYLPQMKMTVVVDVKFDETDGFLDIDLSGDDMGVLIGKKRTDPRFPPVPGFPRSQQGSGRVYPC